MVKFDRFIFVDWSASAKLKTGKGSIWIGSCTTENIKKIPNNTFCDTLAFYPEGEKRQPHWDKILNTDANKKEFLNVASVANPPTRIAAFNFLKDVFNSENKKTLIGFDFGFGYPHKAYDVNGIGKDWENLWNKLYVGVLGEEKKIKEKNRFILAEQWNKKYGLCFWGKNPYSQYKTFPQWAGKVASRICSLKAFRATERLVEWANPKSQWQLYGQGSVGSQTLLGIPYVEKLRRCLKPKRVGVWPFETEFGKKLDDDFDILMCEVHFSAIVCVGEEVGERKDEIRDRVQVEAMCRFFAEQKNAYIKKILSVNDTCVSDADKEIARTKEGWILGVPLCLQNSEHCDICRKINK